MSAQLDTGEPAGADAWRAAGRGLRIYQAGTFLGVGAMIFAVLAIAKANGIRPIRPVFDVAPADLVYVVGVGVVLALVIAWGLLAYVTLPAASDARSSAEGGLTLFALQIVLGVTAFVIALRLANGVESADTQRSLLGQLRVMADFAAAIGAGAVTLLAHSHASCAAHVGLSRVAWLSRCVAIAVPVATASTWATLWLETELPNDVATTLVALGLSAVVVLFGAHWWVTARLARALTDADA